MKTLLDFATNTMPRVQKSPVALSRLILAVSVLCVASVAAAAIPTDPGVPDLNTRETARSWHNTWWPQTYGIPMGFTGDVLNGVPGDVSTDYRNAALLRYNIFRRMVGVQPYVLDAAKNKTAQLAAMYISANGKAQHGGTDSSWKFYSVEADLATQRCMLGLGWNDPRVAWAYLYDFGAANVGAVGHRAYMLAPWMQLTVGLGNVPATASTQETEAFMLDASGSTPNFDPDGFVLWPAAGYVPNYLIAGQWNADIPDAITTGKWSFKGVKITVLRNGVPMTITGGERGASDGAVWTIDGTADGSSDYGWYSLSSGERFYGRPNSSQEVVYHVIFEGLHERVTAFHGGPDLGGGALYKGTGHFEYDVFGYNPDIVTTISIVTQPTPQTVPEGSTALLYVEAIGATTYQWYKDWTALAGATQSWLQVKNFQSSDEGRYHVLASGSGGTVMSSYTKLTYAPAVEESPGKLVNISTRSYVGPGDDVLVSGFVVTGTQPKMVLIRGAGPALKGMISQTPLADPVLTLFNSSSFPIASNDDWSADGPRTALIEAAAKQVWAFDWTRGSKDAAMLVTLAPGLYTAQISGKGTATGIGLLEVYEVGSNGTTRMVNISGRTQNAIADEPAVAGFVIKGTQKRKVLLRAAGPALTGMVTGPMADPVLTLFDSSQTIIATNDDWSSDTTQAAAIEAAAKVTYAFAWTRGSKDAAILVELEPGLYTVQGKGKAGATGICLVEVYEVP